MDILVCRLRGTDRNVHSTFDRFLFPAHNPQKAKLVELRFFGGLTLEQAAEYLGISLSTADRAWRYARAWLYHAMAGENSAKK
jgi:DNA-directed RNA polymerase specialized sigma24 family protein